MSVAQWAPWVSVFLGGCLSGAALLSLSSERAGDAKHSATVTAPPSPPAEPSDHDEAEVDDEDDRVTESDVTASHRDEGETVESEEGPSAADILLALEQAYQRQVAASAVSEPEADPVVAEEASSAEVEAESVTAEAHVPAAPAPVPYERIAKVEAEPRGADATPAEPVQVATAARTEPHHETVQQVAVLYQPVVVLPPTDPGQQMHTSPPRRSVGRDPWAPATVSPRHNPWATSSMSGGAWSTIGVAGGVWGGSFAPRSAPRSAPRR